MRVLWIVSWYPSRLDPFGGDFIKRHAEAASLYNEVEVIHVVRDDKGTVTKDELIESTKNQNLSETIIYYYLPNSHSAFFGSVVARIKYYRKYKKAIKKHLEAKGLPQLVHLHVAIKAGALARWVKKTYGVNYVLSEHWSGFLPEGKADFNKHPFYVRWLCKSVISEAKEISAVSKYLAKQVKEISDRQTFTVIPNVVNTERFYPTGPKGTSVMRFLHVSSLDNVKNSLDILRAFVIAKAHYSNFQLDIFGPEDPSLVAFSSSIGLGNHVSFHKEVPQEELAGVMRNSHALILYSRYETFGCVVIEANACGLPVIVSDIPVMHEIVEPLFNGIIVEGQNPGALANALVAFIEKKYHFDEKKISELARSHYSYSSVGRKFDEWYKRIV